MLKSIFGCTNKNLLFRYLVSIIIILTLIISCSKEEEIHEEEIIVPQPNIYGLFTDSLTQFDGVVKKNETLTDILLPHSVSYQQVSEISKIARDTWNVRKIQKGRKYIIFSSTDSI